MSTRRLYGIAHSRASRCEWALRELGLDYELVPVDNRTGETRRPEFLTVNPNGKVPFLADGDVKLAESMAINLYLARRYLADRAYLVEARFTIADLNTAAVLAAGAFFGHDYADHGHVHAWLRRCFARPAARIRGSTLERFITLLAA